MAARGRRLVVLLALASCHPAAIEATVPAPSSSPVEDGWSRVVVHASLEPPVGLRVSPGIAVVRGWANPGGTVPLPPFERVDQLPVERRCPRDSVCVFTFRNRLVATVFAFDPEVEVDVAVRDDGGRELRTEVRYRDPSSVSAALGRVLEHSAAIEYVCHDTRLQRDDRRARAEPLEQALRELMAEQSRGVVRRAAGLALVQAQCTDAAQNQAIARELLETLEPTAPELQLWTQGLRRLGALAADHARAEALVDAVIDRHPQPAVGAQLLFLRLHDLDDDADPKVREALMARLQAPPFGNTVSAQMAHFTAASHRSIRLQRGDRVPTLELSNLDGGVVRTAEPGAEPQLLYFSASWCGGCIDALPRLRALAQAHPELRIVYVLWDGPDDARRFVTERAPVPGQVAWTDLGTRQRLEAQLLEYVSLPSFVLADGEGTVMATSNDTKLAAVEAIVGELASAGR